MCAFHRTCHDFYDFWAYGRGGVIVEVNFIHMLAILRMRFRIKHISALRFCSKTVSTGKTMA